MLFAFDSLLKKYMRLCQKKKTTIVLLTFSYDMRTSYALLKHISINCDVSACHLLVSCVKLVSLTKVNCT